MPEPISFVKYHSLGNDFIIFEKIPQDYLKPHTIVQLCSRHTGIGADGILVINKQRTNVTVYNANGSLGQICLNGLRCVAHLLSMRNGMPLPLRLTMGSRSFICSLDADTQQITTELSGTAPAQERLIQTQNRSYHGSFIDIGNPHFIITDRYTPQEQLEIGPLLETNPAFTNGTNVEFVWQDEKVQSTWHMRVHERGVGQTQACSSGAAALLMVLHQQQAVAVDEQITVSMLGGSLYGQLSKSDTLLLTAQAVYVFAGTWCPDKQTIANQKLVR